MAKRTRVSIHRVIDKNDFDKVMHERIFTDQNEGYKWAEAQAASIRAEYAKYGEDLLDIDTDWRHLWLDHFDVVTGYTGRPK